MSEVKRSVGRPKKIVDIDYIIYLYNKGYSYRGIQTFIKVNLRKISEVINANQDKLIRNQYPGGPKKRKYDANNT